MLSDGLFVLSTYKAEVFAYFVVTFGLGLFVVRRVENDGQDKWMNIFFSFSVGSAVLAVAAYLLVLFAYFWPSLLRPGSVLGFLFAIFLLVKEVGAHFIAGKTVPMIGQSPNSHPAGFFSFIRLKHTGKNGTAEFGIFHDLRFVAAGLALLLLLVMRLAFLKQLLMPGYSDSPIHYQIVLGFLDPGSVDSKLSLENIFSNYYHFGFHAIAAWLTALSGIAPEKAISLLGQIFLVVAPVSVMFLAHTLTRNVNGALFAGLLAATGWLMPAFAVNWGKFPALASLATLPAVLAVLWLYGHDRNRKPLNLVLVALLLLGSILLHTRIIICILIAVSSLYVSNKLHIGDRLGFFQSAKFALLYMLSLWPLSQLLGEFYRGIPVLVVFLILLPFAFQVHPKLSVGVFIYTFGLWLIVLAPALVIKKFPVLLDRQFIEIMLYIPFSLLGGAGFTGLMRILSPQKIWKWLAVMALLTAVTFSFLQGRTIYPNQCCNYVGEEDMLAFQWIQDNTSERTLFLISTIDDGRDVFGTDAGIWIIPFLGRNANKLPFGYDWKSAEEITAICDTGAEEIYVYMGGQAYSFSNARLAQGQWTRPVFTAGKTIIYQVSGCSN